MTERNNTIINNRINVFYHELSKRLKNNKSKNKKRPPQLIRKIKIEIKKHLELKPPAKNDINIIENWIIESKKLLSLIDLAKKQEVKK